jgi:hypothetical protein
MVHTFYCFPRNNVNNIFLFTRAETETAGKNIMFLVLFMLLAQALYTGNINTNSKVCFALGVALHCCWLLSIFWMNICTFHLLRVFSMIWVMSNEAWLKIFVRYHCFDIVMSFVFFALNITLSLLSSGKSGYGGRNCNISSQKRSVTRLYFRLALMF